MILGPFVNMMMDDRSTEIDPGKEQTSNDTDGEIDEGE